MHRPEYTFRPALPAEFPNAMAIDDAAGTLFPAVGISFAVADDHPFVVDEHARWRRALDRGELVWAIDGAQPIGFYALGVIDGRAYLDQLSVRPEHGRRGVGRALLERACDVVRRRGEPEILLTTYDCVPWNRPFYERNGFELLPELECGPEVRALLSDQRAVLPRPEWRVAMRRRL